MHPGFIIALLFLVALSAWSGWVLRDRLLDPVAEPNNEDDEQEAKETALATTTEPEASAATEESVHPERSPLSSVERVTFMMQVLIEDDPNPMTPVRVLVDGKKHTITDATLTSGEIVLRCACNHA